MTETRKLVRVWMVCVWSEFSHEEISVHIDEAQAWEEAESLALADPKFYFVVVPGVRSMEVEE